MNLVVNTPHVDQLGLAIGALREWQDDAVPLQLHPGDIGWHWQFGAEATAAAVRTWSRDGQIVAVGMLDGPTLLRLTVAPDVVRDEELARHVVSDVNDPERGVLPAGKVSVEVPMGVSVHDALADVGWVTDEAWTPLSRDLSEPVEDSGLRIEIVGSELVGEYSAVHRSAFGSPKFTVERWHTMADGSPFADARSLIGFDAHDNAVAMATVWSAGPGKPGVIEPLGGHQDHRGHGYGTAMSVAAAAALQQLGASSATVCTPSENVAAVATYKSAGYLPQPERLDKRRDA